MRANRQLRCVCVVCSVLLAFDVAFYLISLCLITLVFSVFVVDVDVVVVFCLFGWLVGLSAVVVLGYVGPSLLLLLLLVCLICWFVCLFVYDMRFIEILFV